MRLRDRACQSHLAFSLSLTPLLSHYTPHPCTVVRKGFPVAGVRKEHQRFLSEFGLDEVDVPLVELDTLDWESPVTAIVLQYG